MLRNTLDRIGHGARRAGSEGLDALEQLRERRGTTGESQSSQLAGFATGQSEFLTDRVGAGAPRGVEPALPAHDRVHGRLAQARVEVRCRLPTFPAWPTHRLISYHADATSYGEPGPPPLDRIRAGDADGPSRAPAGGDGRLDKNRTRPVIMARLPGRGWRLMLDLEALLHPAPSEPPSGPNLQYTTEFSNLERAAAGRPERQVGGLVVAAEPPEWRAVVQASCPLLTASKDIRVAITLARALIEVDGFGGLADGLTLVRRLVAQYWDTFHPQLDAEDANDPTSRVNAMGALTHRDMIQAIRGAPLITSKTFGSVTLRAIDAASARPTPAKAAAAGPDGKAAPESASAPTLTTIEAAFQQVQEGVLADASATLHRCSQEVRMLAEAWAERLPSSGPDFTELRKVIYQAEQAIKTRLDPRQAEEANRPAAEGPAAAADAAPTMPRGEVRSRDDVLRAIDAICAYYAKAEPSSPVPLLLQRSRRLVTMSFTDILKEMLPEAIPNLQKISGKTDG
jgi:type VI secretion system protein ImpA